MSVRLCVRLKQLKKFIMLKVFQYNIKVKIVFAITIYRGAMLSKERDR